MRLWRTENESIAWGLVHDGIRGYDGVPKSAPISEKVHDGVSQHRRRPEFTDGVDYGCSREKGKKLPGLEFET